MFIFIGIKVKVIFHCRKIFKIFFFLYFLIAVIKYVCRRSDTYGVQRINNKIKLKFSRKYFEYYANC